MYPTEYLYSKDHEWVKVDGDECVLGITHFAQEELGEVVFVEMPDAGQTFDAHEEIGTIESVKAVAEVYTPVGCEIIGSNDALNEAPELVNEEPHGKGWLVKIRLSSREELTGLMDAAASEQFAASGE